MGSLFPCLALMLWMFTFSEAREFLVGGQENSWKVPPSPDDFNRWAGKMRFLIGDYLVLKYDPKTDSVLQVTEEDYEICNTAKPIKAYNDGDTRIPLERSGSFYFISGTEGHCAKGQKLVVKVLSPKHGSRGTTPPAASPAPEPAPFQSTFPVPAPAPTGDGHVLNPGVVSLAVILGNLVGLALRT
ncbi:hypothetical protein U1Q18_028005 [Sarracenia purpurea var. burkii]